LSFDNSKIMTNNDVDPAAAIPVGQGAQTEAQDFSCKAKDLGALREAVVDAASAGSGLWFSYLFVSFYLATAVGGVTHRDLFLQNPIRLPFLNVELPLVAFSVIGPLLFLILHGYLLMNLVLLADKVEAFDTELRVQVPDEDTRESLRRQLPINTFIQFLAGCRAVRTGLMGGREQVPDRGDSNCRGTQQRDTFLHGKSSAL